MEISLRGFLKAGEPWFIAKDVTTALGYASGPNAVAKHVDLDQKGVTKSMTPGGQQQLTIISEGGFYSLVMVSKLPSAKAFKRWVMDVVLPSLRKHGRYVMGQEKLVTGEMDPREFMARALVMAQSVIAEANTVDRPHGHLAGRRRAHHEQPRHRRADRERAQARHARHQARARGPRNRRVQIWALLHRRERQTEPLLRAAEGSDDDPLRWLLDAAAAAHRQLPADVPKPRPCSRDGSDQSLAV